MTFLDLISKIAPVIKDGLRAQQLGLDTRIILNLKLMKFLYSCGWYTRSTNRTFDK